MRSFVLVFIAATIMATPFVARADDASSGPLPPPNPAAMAVMEQTHAKIEQLHAQARLSMLSALTPSHRTLLAQIAAQLVVAAAPDSAAAARALDASLSPSERKAVLDISTSFHEQAKQLFDAARQQMGASAPGAGPRGMNHMYMSGMGDGEAQITAGTVLLMMAAHSISPEPPMGMPAPHTGMSH